MISVSKTSEIEIQRNYLYKMRIDASVRSVLMRIAPSLMSGIKSELVKSNSMSPSDYLLDIDLLNREAPKMEKNGKEGNLDWKHQDYYYAEKHNSSGTDTISFFDDAAGSLASLMRLMRNCSVLLDDNAFFFTMYIDKYDINKKTILSTFQYVKCKIYKVTEEKLKKDGNDVNKVTVFLSWQGNYIS